MLTTSKWLLLNGVAPYSFDNAVKSQKLVTLAAGEYAKRAKESLVSLKFWWFLCQVSMQEKSVLHLIVSI